MSRFQAWKTAARVHTLPAAVVPVMVGSGLAYGEEVYRWDAFLWALIGALAIQVAANFANDASDARRGADTPDRIGPPRMVSLGVISPASMWTATWIAIAVAGVAALALTLIAGPWVLVIGVASVLAMLGYVGGPVPYGYRGFGEVFVFLFFGLVATVGARFVHDGNAPRSAWLLAIPVGMLATAILVVNNYRDIQTDTAAGKRTLAVILGPDRTKVLYSVLMVGAFVLIAGFAVAKLVPVATITALFMAPIALTAARSMGRATGGAELLMVLKLTARIHLYTGLILASGAAIG